MKRNEILAKAKEYFTENPNADKVIATTDGHLFKPEAAHLAHRHAQQNALKAMPIQREETEITEAEKPKKEVKTNNTKQ